MRVLVVDESTERAEILREGLRLAGHEVTASLSSPVALLKTIEELKPDVIVIDTESLIDVAVARFEDFQRLRGELAEATLKLSERKLVERAKGLLMKTRGIDEETAYGVQDSVSMAIAIATLARLQTELRCGTNCGSCVPELRRMLRDEAPVTT